jgi:adenylate kinase
MIVIIFGPQGSGKGTQAELIAQKTGMLAFSMGDALRHEIHLKTEIGHMVEGIMARGELVPAEITNNILSKIINSPEADKGILIDGYPRIQEQLEFYSKNFHTDYAFELDLSEEESIKRISARRICPNCGHNYNTIWLKPKIEGKCDSCNVDLEQREDDKPAEVKRRLEIYNKNTLPMKEYYEKLGVLHVIDASGEIEEVNKKIMDILSSHI